MGLKSTSVRYGTFAIGIHWLSALLIIGMFAAGIMASQTTDPAQKAPILQVHAPVGLAVLGLTSLRIIWWLFADKKPVAVRRQPVWQVHVSRWVHRLLYLCILAMAWSGIWLMNASSVGEIIAQGGKKPMPEFEAFAAYQVHSNVALFFEALLVLHVLVALYHQFIRKDRLLARMGIGRKLDI
jgi:cytochrome b561